MGEKKLTISPSAVMIASKLQTACFRSSALSLEKTISIIARQAIAKQMPRGGVKVSAVGRQKEQPGSFGSEQLLSSFAFVEGDISF